MTKEVLLTIDPGYSTGWALWRNSRSPVTGQITLPRGRFHSLEEKLNYMWVEFELLLTKKKPTQVLIEGVELWSSSVKSHTSGVRGDLFKLSYLVGGYANIANNYGAAFGLINFKEWGAQLTPEAVRSWVKRVIGKEYKSQHITDAVAMGLSFLGKFKKDDLQKV